MPATTDCLWELQQAIYIRLSTDATIISLAAGVFDQIPQPEIYPYIQIGEATQRFNDSFGSGNSSRSSIVTFTFHIWSQDFGFKSALAIKRQMYQLLHKQEASLNVNGYNINGIRQDFSTTLRNADGKTRHIVDRYRIWLDELN